MNTLHAKYWFGRVDSRPLSVFRIFFAGLLLKNAIYSIPLATEFYSDAGYVPRSALWDGLARTDRFPLWMLCHIVGWPLLFLASGQELL
jgi:hypothetical protein